MFLNNPKFNIQYYKKKKSQLNIIYNYTLTGHCNINTFTYAVIQSVNYMQLYKPPTAGQELQFMFARTNRMGENV